MRIIDLSAGNRAVWFDKNHRDAVYVDVRPEVGPSIVADARALPAAVGLDFNLVVFDPPHVNFGAKSNMSRDYGHYTTSQIRDIISGTAREAHRITAPDALMAFKWNDHDQPLGSVLDLMRPYWEPLFGHGVSPSHRQRSMTAWVMLRRAPAAVSQDQQDIERR